MGTLKQRGDAEQRPAAPGPPWGSSASRRHQILTEAVEELKITVPPSGGADPDLASPKAGLDPEPPTSALPGPLPLLQAALPFQMPAIYRLYIMQMSYKGLLRKRQGAGATRRWVVTGAGPDSSERTVGMEGATSVSVSARVSGGCQGALPRPSPLL